MLRIVFMGSPKFSVPSLEQLIINKYEVVAVYTQPDRPLGPGAQSGGIAGKRSGTEVGNTGNAAGKPAVGGRFSGAGGIKTGCYRGLRFRADFDRRHCWIYHPASA